MKLIKADIPMCTECGAQLIGEALPYLGWICEKCGAEVLVPDHGYAPGASPSTVREVIGKIQSVLRTAEQPARGTIVVRRVDLVRWAEELEGALK